ncbi:MAG: condensation domain-containing protein [Candidatus Odinarchaeota archaeon]
MSEMNYRRKVSPLEGMFVRVPYATVTVVARIKGNVTEKMLKDAVSKVQKRHVNLRTRIEEDADHILWFTSEDVKEIPMEVVTRKSEDHWIEVYQEASKIPFDFNERPAIRLVLVQSSTESELVILCNHTICDGMSLAYLARDLMDHLGNPDLEVEVLPDPVPINSDNIPQDVTINRIVKFIIDRMNKNWEKEKINFDQEDYKNINDAFWENFKYQMISIELSEKETTSLVELCRSEGVTVNSAITAAFAGASSIIQDKNAYEPSIAVAGSMRNRIPKEPASGAMGYYAGSILFKFNYDLKSGFWENTRKLNQKVKPLYTNKNLFKEPLLWCHLESGILESMCFKIVGKLVPSDSTRYEKLSTFSKRKDVISDVVKRGGLDSFDKTLIGTAITNLTRFDFPRKYGSLELDRLIFKAGGAFPLANVNLLVGAVTCSGKLSIIIEYEEGTVDTATAAKIKEKAMEFLLSN